MAGGGSLSVGSATSPIATNKKIFLITQGPVITGVLLQEGPTSTTDARYITANDGHVLDVPLDVPGAFPQVISETTIPGIEQAFFTDSGNGAIVQYLEGNAVKTAHLSFSAPGAASSTPIIQFLPDGIEDIAPSPNGTQVAYLLTTNAGVNGYISQSDGSKPALVFSLPLSQVVLSWPSPHTLMAYTKAASGIPGIVFSINTATGAVSPLLYGLGITAAADASFADLLYQIADGSAVTTFTTNPATDTSTPLMGIAQSLFPEQCVSTSTPNSPILYCASPQSPQGGNVLDLWHQGQASPPDTLILLNLATGGAEFLGTPGSSDGGENATITDISVAPQGGYLSFVNKNDGSFWGMHVSQ